VDAWLDGLDIDAVEIRDGKHLREIGRALSALEAAEEQLKAAIAAAHAAGDSWAMIGVVLGTSKQAAHRRFGQSPVEKR
jgi:hypothetical protein